MIPTDPAEIAAAQWAGLAGELAFDVGAHLGENFPHLRAGGAKRIIAVEPELDLFSQLLDQSADDVTTLLCAVGGQEGFLKMRRANGMLGNLTGDEQVRSVCRTLDSLADQYGTPDVVVVDVEGFEMQVLTGATGLLGALQPSWLVEFHSEPLFYLVWTTLAGAGYSPQVIRHPHYRAGSGLWLGHGWIKALRPAGRGDG